MPTDADFALLGRFDPPACLDRDGLELAGNGIRLAPLEVAHAAGLQHWADVREPGFDLVRGGPNDHDWSMAGFFAELVQLRDTRDDVVPLVVVNDATGAVLGYTRYLKLDPGQRVVEVGGTWYAPPARGTIVNVAAKRLLLAHAFEACGFNRVPIITDARNERSRRAIAGIGATYEGTLRADSQLRDGGVRDTWVASVVRPEWPRVRDLLDARIATAAPAPPDATNSAG